MIEIVGAVALGAGRHMPGAILNARPVVLQLEDASVARARVDAPAAPQGNFQCLEHPTWITLQVALTTQI